MLTDTIVAQCTPSGKGAIALLRISGMHAQTIVAQCALLSSKKDLIQASSHTIHHGWIVNADGQKLDEVLFFIMHAPRTFTGENVVEITCHNNSFIIENIIERLVNCGARLAQAGEFSRQAVENNKLDLVQTEPINELIQANSQQLLKQSLDQLQGSFSQWIHSIETETIKLIALCEASFEFLEEEMDFSGEMLSVVNRSLHQIDSLKKTFDQQQQLRQGVRIAIIGSVNAGKSSLFNALVGKKRAIVTDIAGTTRDIIEAGMYENGIYITLVDTAGLRTTDDIIEQEGIERALNETKMADVILLTMDANQSISEQEKIVYTQILEQHEKKIILIKNKIDLGNQEPELFPEALTISTKTKDGLEKLKDLLSLRIQKLFEVGASPFLLNKRHFTLLLAFEKELLKVKTMLYHPIDYELIAYHLKEALSCLTELTGKSISEKALDAIFKEFCVGK